MDYSSLKRELVTIYRARAKRYDWTANLYYLMGYREWRYRRQAVDALDSRPGDTVVEVACGTGLNFELLMERIGPSGRLIGVDLTDAMLAEAGRRVAEQGWQNVELVQMDALAYDFPAGVNRILSTYALSLIPECDEVIRRGARSLSRGGRLALLELQIPDNWPGWMAKLAVALTRPFGLTEEWLERRPWHTIRWAMRDTLTGVQAEERYLGSTYIISGSKGCSNSPKRETEGEVDV